VDGGTTILTSPPLDFSSEYGRISYARWYSNSVGSDPHNDVMLVYVTNGSQEALVETVGPVDQATGGWFTHSFVVQDFVAPNAKVRVRFEVSDLLAGSVVEAAVDAFEVTAYQCATQLRSYPDASPSNPDCPILFSLKEVDNPGVTSSRLEGEGSISGLPGRPLQSGASVFRRDR
jgi:hypothetical protein